MNLEHVRIEVARWLEIVLGLVGAGLIVFVAVKRETGAVVCLAPPPFPWVTATAAVILVMPWTMGRAFARSFLTSVVAKVPLPRRLTATQATPEDHQ